MTKEKLDYNYVFFGNSNEVCLYSYADIIDINNSRFLDGSYDITNFILKIICRIHTSPRLNKYISLPFRSIWFSRYFKNTFHSNKKICFVFIATSKVIDEKYITYLRKKYPGSKFVLYFQDLVAKKKGIDIDSVKLYFDMIISFDPKEAKKYNLKIYPLVYSKGLVFNNIIKNKDVDVYFLGKAKNRLEEILLAYEQFTKLGLICDFNIVGVPKNKQKYCNEINYCKKMAYKENIKRILSSKAILEIVQKGGVGYTLRMCEAIVYDKKIISNNPFLKKEKFFNDELIKIYDKNISEDTVSFINNELKVDYHWKEELSPIKLLEYIDLNLEKR